GRYVRTLSSLVLSIPNARTTSSSPPSLHDALPILSKPLHTETKNRLDRMGADWHFLLPLQPLKGKFQRPDLRNHRKLLVVDGERSEEHTSELQSRENLVCRLLLEKKKDIDKLGAAR